MKTVKGNLKCNGYWPYTIVCNGHCPILNYSVHIYRNTVAECTYLITNVHGWSQTEESLLILRLCFISQLVGWLVG